MLLSFFLLFFLCASTVKSTTAQFMSYTTLPGPHIITTVVEEKLSSLQLEATPDYPVAAGQTVELHCSAFTMPSSVSWYWQRLENQTWQDVDTDRDLTLTKPEQSGIYRCRAESRLSQRAVSPSHAVYIVSMRATGENLGIAALVLSLLALIINLAIVFWLSWQRLGDATSNTVAKGFPRPQKSPKGDFPQTGSDGDVYINYTSTNESYADLDPNTMTGDTVYSSLS